MARTTKAPQRGRGGRTARAAVAPAPKVSKGELRERVVTLEETNARLRGRNRELGRAAKAASARVAELEQQLAALERRQARAQAPRQAGRRARAIDPRGIDPGDAVPPGVAVEEPEPLDEEADAAWEGLQQHFPGD